MKNRDCDNMVLVIAHRGFSGKYPENTLLAIRKAIEAGADGVEFDVRATKDGRLVLFHDTSLKRLVHAKGKIKNKTYAELRNLRVKKKEKILLLNDALEYLRKNKIKVIVIEVKIKGFEKEIMDMVTKKKLASKVILSSFHASVIKNFYEFNKKVRLAYIMDNKPDRFRTWRVLNKKVKLYSIHHFHRRPLSTKRFIKRIKKNGLKVLPWFSINYSNEEKRMRQLIRMGVDGIITDRPDILKIMIKEEQLRKRKK